MLKIALINQKGGGCKSTTAALLASCFASVGRKVVVDDRDPVQGTLTAALKFMPNVEAYTPGCDAEICFIDTPGTLQLPEVSESIMDARKVIIPTSCSSTDISSTAKALKYIQEVKPDVVRALLFCRVSRGHTQDFMDKTAAALKTPRLEGVIPHRIEFERLLVHKLKITADDRKTIAAIAKEIMELGK